MKSIIKDEKAIIPSTVEFIASLAILYVLYTMLVPLVMYIGDTVISLGTPAAQILFYQKMLRYTFYVFLIAVVVIYFTSVYKKTYTSERLP